MSNVRPRTVDITSPELKERFFAAAEESPGSWVIAALSLRAAAARLDWLTAPVRDDESSVGFMREYRMLLTMILLSFLPLLLVLILCAAYAKLAARIFRRSSLSWRNSFLFAFLLGLLAIAGRATSTALGYSLPIAVGLLVGLAINLLLGGWFFAIRATDTQGQLLGWRRGVFLSAIMFGLLVVTVFALMGLVHVLTPLAQP